MTTTQNLVVRNFNDRAEGLAHFMLRAGEAPRFIAIDDQAGCPTSYFLNVYRMFMMKNTSKLQKNHWEIRITLYYPNFTVLKFRKVVIGKT